MDESVKRELAAALAKQYREGSAWTIPAFEALVKAGVELNTPTCFTGLVIMAFGVGRIGSGINPEQFGELAKMLAEAIVNLPAGEDGKVH